MKSRSTTLRGVDALCRAALVPRERLDELAAVAARYAVAITPVMAAAIDRSDPHDPIARQFVPDAREFLEQPEERRDPIGDDAFSPIEGMVHRYPDRVLLKVVNACVVYCRFCFRREMVGPGRGGLSPAALAAALDYIRGHPKIWEVILTGGDPLILSARRIGHVVKKIAAIAHVKIIRVHTRVPAVAPERITPALVRALRARSKATFVVLHANHPRELSKQARAACVRLIDAGIPMLSQIGAVARGERRCRDAWRADARLGRVPHQALLSAPWRSRARHGASAHQHRRRAGSHAWPSRPLFGPLSTGLRARHTRRLRQVADRPELFE